MSDTLLPGTAEDVAFVPTQSMSMSQADVLSEDRYRPTLHLESLVQPRRRFQVWLDVEVELQALLVNSERNWDGYGAATASPKAVSRASRLLNTLTDAGVDGPRLGLLSDGGVRAEWESREGEVWVDVPEHGSVELFAARKDEPLEWEGDLADAPDWALALLPLA